MLNEQGFDLWADGYDQTVGLSDEENTYPFAGYKQVLGAIFREVMRRGGGDVLDIGFGTGVLTSRLYQQGCRIWGQDFSSRMVELTQSKLPKAELYCGSFADGLAAPLKQRRYDAIIATYSLHHLTDEQKKTFIAELMGQLKSGGVLLIGDVAFENREAMEACRADAGDDWDDEEVYFVMDEWPAECKARFEKISHCAGVISVQREAFGFDRMLAMQRELQEKYFHLWGGLGLHEGRNQLLWMIAEVGEVADIIKKKGEQAIMEDAAIRDHFVEELCDVMMYFNDILLCFDISAEELEQVYLAKHRRNMTRW